MLTRRSLIAQTCQASAAVWASRAAAEPAPAAQPRPLRIAQIGLQGHYGEVLAHLPRLENCRLVAAAKSMPDEPIETLRRQPAWNDQVRVYEDYRRMLDEIRPDVVAVFMPYGLNGQANIEAVRRGCHVVSEKPLAGTLDELDRLRRERDRAGVKVTALLSMRLDPSIATARRAVADGSIGEPVLVSAQKSYRWGSGRPAFYKQRRMYGGSIPWVAIHAIDFMRYVSGLEFADVTARQAVKVHTDYPGCEDCGALLFGMSNGGQAALTFDFLRPQAALSHGDDRLRVVGSKGIVEVRVSGESFCELITQDAPPRRLPPEPKGPSLFESFVEHLRGGPSPVLSSEDGFRATEVALKARDAADSSSTVRL